MADWYVGSEQYAAIAQWQAEHTYAVGDIVRSPDATVEQFRQVLVATVAGASATAEPVWPDIYEPGQLVTDGSVTWEMVTGNSAYAWGAAAWRICTVMHDIYPGVSAGDRVFVASDHHAFSSESDPSFGIPRGAQIISVDPMGSVPPTAADYSPGATEIDSVGNNIWFQIGSWQEECRIFGMTFKADDNPIVDTHQLQLNLNPTCLTRSCEFHWGITPSDISDGSGTLYLTGIVENIRINPRNANNPIGLGSFSVLRGCSGMLMGTVTPNPVFRWSSGVVEGCDFSDFDADIVLADASVDLHFVNCHLPAGYSIGPTYDAKGVFIEMAGSSASDASRFEKWADAGKLLTDFNVIRVGGANDGLAPYSWALTCFYYEYGVFSVPPLVIWNESVGTPVVCTIELLCDGETLTEADLWLEVAYLSDNGVPLAEVIYSRDTAPLVAPAPLAESASGWSDETIADPIKQKLEVTFVPQMAGFIRAAIRTSSATVGKSIWIDPKITLT